MRWDCRSPHKPHTHTRPAHTAPAQPGPTGARRARDGQGMAGRAFAQHHAAPENTLATRRAATGGHRTQRHGRGGESPRLTSLRHASTTGIRQAVREGAASGAGTCMPSAARWAGTCGLDSRELRGRVARGLLGHAARAGSFKHGHCFQRQGRAQNNFGY